MSYILDALRKSESERQQQNLPGFADIPRAGRSKSKSVWIWLLAALLLVNAAVLAVLLIDKETQSSNRRETLVVPVTNNTAEPSFRDIVNDVRDEVPADVIATPPTTAVAARVVAAATTASTPPATQTTTPASTRAARSSSSGPAASTPSAATAVPSLMELRANGVLQLPDMHLDIHVYSEKPADRFVFINMTKYREQSRLEEGPLLKEIRTDGVLLEHRGHEFILPRE